MYLFDKASTIYNRGGIREVANKSIDVSLTSLHQDNLYIKKRKYFQDKSIKNMESDGIGKDIRNVNFSKKKTSTEVFLLGSGSSINAIEQAQWGYINKHDSIGLNRWPIHWYTPTFHVFEIPKMEYPKMREDYWKLLNYRQKDYKNINLVLKDVIRFDKTVNKNRIPDWLMGELYLSTDIVLPPLVRNSRDRFRKSLDNVINNGYLTFGRGPGVLFKKRGSISYLIFLAISLGYDKIILCGVDMVDSSHFWDNSDGIPEDVPIPSPSTQKKKTVHTTIEPRSYDITLEEAIYDIKEKILEPNGVEIYTATKKSALHPKIPYFEIPKV